MRKFFVSKADTHRIELEDGQWIDILAICSHRTRNKAMAAMLKPTAGIDKSVRVNMDFNVSAFNDVLLKEMIVDWSFADEEGKKIPVTPENIDNLAADITQWVIEEIGRLNPVKTEPGKNAL